MDFLTLPIIGKPLWMWAGFILAVLALLAFDLGVVPGRKRGPREIGVRDSLMMSLMYISLGLGFGGLVWMQLGPTAGVEYLTGFVIEKSLAIDNVFVIALIFGFFAIPPALQHRVLFWGVLGVIILRGIMIGIGAALVSQFGWVLYIFAAFLILTGVKMLFAGDKPVDLNNNAALKWLRRVLPVSDKLEGERFFVRGVDKRTGKMALLATPLFLALVLVELADLVFAVDSVPAIFAITTDPYIVYTSNIMAILGLRALYFALAAVLHRFAYLKQALAVLLVFIGGKIFIADALGWEKFPAGLSLSITFAILAAGVGWSLWKTRKAPALPGAPGASG
ncbi:tellurite resistance protein TerC [Caulobacter sp. BE264]|nr:tellurite resistance protein TerC [Caulobacter sp. BE264]